MIRAKQEWSRSGHTLRILEITKDLVKFVWVHTPMLHFGEEPRILFEANIKKYWKLVKDVRPKRNLPDWF